MPSALARDLPARDLIDHFIHQLVAYRPTVTVAPAAVARRSAVAMIVRVHLAPGAVADASDLAGNGLSPTADIRVLLDLPWVVAPSAKCQILFMKRAESPRDPWSGHVAFPGGRVEAGESDLEAAIRECREEIGLDLSDPTCFRLLGRLDDRVIRRRNRPTLSLRPFVFMQICFLTPALCLQPTEVAAVRWVSVDRLLSPDHRKTGRFIFPLDRYFPSLARVGVAGSVSFPHLRLEAEDELDMLQTSEGLEFILWGITLEIVSDAFYVCGIGRIFEIAFWSNHSLLDVLVRVFFWHGEFPTRHHPSLPGTITYLLVILLCSWLYLLAAVG